MDKVIVYVDNAEYAQQMLAPLFARESSTRTHWVLVACAPRMTHRVSKWVSHSARENWRAKWADKLFAQILPALHVPAGRVTTVLAKGPLAELTDQLQAEGTAVAQVVDARRPKIDTNDRTDAAPGSAPRRAGGAPLSGKLGSLLTGCGALWMLALE